MKDNDFFSKKIVIAMSLAAVITITRESSQSNTLWTALGTEFLFNR